MSTEITAMQEFILWMKNHNMDCTSLAMIEAKRLLSKEKEQINTAFDDGVGYYESPYDNDTDNYYDDKYSVNNQNIKP